MDDVLRRNNVRVAGAPAGRPMVLVHGFGCDQHMWRQVVPHFADDHRIVLLDLVGAGRSDLSAYDPARHGSLDGYADDVLEVCRALDLTDVVLVGHSVSAMIAVLAANREPGEELTNSFCRTDPEIARAFARVTFLSDNRSDLPRVRVPALVLQTAEDAIAPVEVGRYVHDAIPGSRLRVLDAIGHCPNLSAPAETAAAIRDFISS
jgi:sigma-B regulation protein RsbQ